MGYLEAIEERAKELYPDAFDEDNSLIVKEGRIVKLQRTAYRVGATEQEKITIEKACKFFFEYFVEKYEAMSGQGCDAFCWEFRKYMEE